MIKEIKPRGYWTKEKCQDVSLLCSSKSEYQSKYRSSYIRSLKKGWLDEITNHMNILIANKKYDVDENYFENINTEEKSYWLGFLYADGYVRMKNDRSGELKLKLKRSDKNHIELFKKCLGSTHKITDGISKVTISGRTYTSECSTISIYNTKMVNDLISHGCMNNKTFKISLPNLREDLMRHFIRGYFDGDGHITNSKKNYFQIGILGNEKFISSLYDLLNGYIIGDIYKHKKGKVFNLHIGNNYSCIRIRNYFYDNSNIYLNRKKIIFDKIINNSL